MAKVRFSMKNQTQKERFSKEFEAQKGRFSKSWMLAFGCLAGFRLVIWRYKMPCGTAGLSSFSLEKYSAALEAKGYTVKLKMDASVTVRGYTIQSGNSVYKSSVIGRDLTPSRIQETWKKMRPENRYGQMTPSERVAFALSEEATSFGPPFFSSPVTSMPPPPSHKTAEAADPLPTRTGAATRTKTTSSGPAAASARHGRWLIYRG